MKYNRNRPNAARRHLEAAVALDHPSPKPRRDVAGYLYGLAGEIALKQLMVESGIQELPAASRKSDPYFLHFPAIKTALLNSPLGRLDSRLLPFTAARVMENWDTSMRYAHGREVTDELVEAWARDARELVKQMGAL